MDEGGNEIKLKYNEISEGLRIDPCQQDSMNQKYLRSWHLRGSRPTERRKDSAVH